MTRFIRGKPHGNQLRARSFIFRFAAEVSSLGNAIAFGEALRLWLATLVEGIAVVAGDDGLILTGKNDLQSLRVTPRHTMETLREDWDWAKEQANRVSLLGNGVPLFVVARGNRGETSSEIPPAAAIKVAPGTALI